MPRRPRAPRHSRDGPHHLAHLGTGKTRRITLGFLGNGALVFRFFRLTPRECFPHQAIRCGVDAEHQNQATARKIPPGGLSERL
jgi:hypothetical protein